MAPSDPKDVVVLVLDEGVEGDEAAVSEVEALNEPVELGGVEGAEGGLGALGGAETTLLETGFGAGGVSEIDTGAGAEGA